VTQVLKAAVRERILAAGRETFFEHGYHGAALADIARRAGVSTANIYRYYPDKSALFEAVLPDELLARHDELLDARVDALIGPDDPHPTAGDLLDFWVEHRLAVATLLDHDGQTNRTLYRRAFVQRLVAHVERTLTTPLSATHRRLLVIVFDNTRRAIAAILRSTSDPDELRALIAGFWSYQVPGLEGLSSWMGAPGRADDRSRVQDGA
jgi:AcrR family transcriptional regulator